jgi:glutathione S-transferase
MMGNANHFKNYAKNIADDPKQLEYGTKRFVGEVDRPGGVMDAQLGANEYLAGATGITDMITWPWAMLLDRLIGDRSGEVSQPQALGRRSRCASRRRRGWTVSREAEDAD